MAPTNPPEIGCAIQPPAAPAMKPKAAVGRRMKGATTIKELASVPRTKITTRHLSSAPSIPPTKTPDAVGAPDLSCVELPLVIGGYLCGVRRLDGEL